MASEMRPSPANGMAGMSGMGHDVIGLGAFVMAWLAMMTAMMFPAVMPVVKLYGRAVAAARVAPLPFFVAGYLVVWTAVGVPAYFAWRSLLDPIAEARPWAGRLAGGVLVLAAAWQLTPLKATCLRHCRSPMSVFLRSRTSASRPAGALRLGGTHGLFCLGCCWALMLVLVAMGTMDVAWMAVLAGLILLEKNAPAGERIALGAAAAFGVLGALLLARPETLTTLT